MAADHVPEREHDVASDVRAGCDDEEPDREQHGRQAARDRAAIAQQDGGDREAPADEHEQAVHGSPRARPAVRVRVVGQAGDHRGHERELTDDAGQERATCHAREIEDEGDEERADRHIRDCRVKRVAEPGPVEEVLDRPNRAEQRDEHTVDGVADRTCPGFLGVEDAGEQPSEHQ